MSSADDAEATGRSYVLMLLCVAEGDIFASQTNTATGMTDGLDLERRYKHCAQIELKEVSEVVV